MALQRASSKKGAYERPFLFILNLSLQGEDMEIETALLLNSDLLNRAEKFSSKEEVKELLEETLRHFCECHAAFHLANLGGSQPDMELIPRRPSP